MKKIFFLAFILLFTTGCIFQKKISQNEMPVNSTKSSVPNVNNTPSSQSSVQFQIPKKTPHYESSAPAHASVLGAAPYNVVIDFNFDLVAGSALLIQKDGVEYGEGDVMIDENKLALRRRMKFDAPDGLYSVEYSACWPDQSCHQGMFQFAIDHSLASEYQDFRGKTEVEIDMKDIAFSPMQIRISPGTEITWKNSDEVVHYVNTDAHPAHTFFADQNSSALEKNDTYKTSFSEPGVYLYHCSAHADTMTGTILVE